MIKKLLNVISTLGLCLVIMLAILLAGVRVIGLTPYCVLSGSMEPTYHTGSLIYVKHIQPQDIKVGDPITFVLNEDLVVATHRVISVDNEKEYFYTKGDANTSADGSPVHFNNLIGKPVFTIPYMGYVSNYLTTPPGMYIGISLALVLILLTIAPDLFNKVGKETKASEKERAQV